MMDVPKYWNSKYYDKEENRLSKDAPEYLKDEWELYNRSESVDKENYTVY